MYQDEIVVYKLRHIPTDLYFTPSRHPHNNNLSTTGKVYNRKPSLNMLGRVVYHTTTIPRGDKLQRIRREIAVVPKEWELVTYRGKAIAAVSFGV